MRYFSVRGWGGAHREASGFGKEFRSVVGPDIETLIQRLKPIG